MRARFLTGLALLVTAALVRPGAAQVPSETLAFTSLADTYVESAAPTTNFDADARLRADLVPVRIAYLRFAVTGVQGRAVLQARLRLQVSGQSTSGGAVHVISDHSWDERTLTWETRPAVDGPALSTLGRVAVGALVEWNLDGAVTGDGVYDLAIDNPIDDAASYVSAASTSGQKPALVLTVAAGPAPTVRILQPAPGASFFLGDRITLQGSALDDLDGDLGASLAWTSNLAGFLGTGASLTVSLPEGTHTITAEVQDHDGFTGTAAVAVTVGPPPPANTPPLVTITAPQEGRVVGPGQAVSLAAAASDLEDGVLTARIAWTSDRDGALGTGGTLARVLSAGTHRLSATATDAGGLTGTAAVTVTVRPGTIVEITASADTYVDASLPTTAFGTGPIFKVDANTLRIGYLRFTVTGVGTAATRAVLRLRVDTATSAASDSGGSVYPLADVGWDERLVTFNNRPAVVGSPLATTGAVVAGQTVDFEVSAAVPGDGTYAFALMSASSDGVEYRTREGGPAPTLVLTLAGTPPAVAIVAPADGTVVTTGTPVVLQGSATDVEDGDLSAALAWASSLDGPLGTGASLTTATLRAGTHTLSAVATDLSGLRGEARVTLTVRAPNTPPVVTIGAPVDGSAVTVGSPVALSGSALDDLDGNLSSRLAWTSSLDGPLGTGASLGTAALRTGLHVITAAVTDSGGLRGEARITLTVRPPNAPPVVTVTAPVDGASVAAGTAVVLAATATDAADGDLSAAVVWTSSLDGPLGTGATRTTTALRPGVHGLTAAVTDAGGLRAAATVRLTVLGANAAPAVTITTPATGSVLVAGRPAALAAAALDDFDGDLGARIVWTSSLQGTLGTGTSVSPTLVAGTHVLTAAATDAGGLQGAAQITVVVDVAPAVNTPPSVLIAAPRDGKTCAAGESLVFFGTADDAEDGLLASGLVWTSDRDGVLGTGPTFVRTLSAGTHRITAAVTDGGGLQGAAVVTIAVVPPTVLTFTATADTYVDSANPTKGFGGASKLSVEGGTRLRETLLRFNVTGVGTGTVGRARLRLTVGSSRSDGGPVGGTVHAITNTTWSESKTTWTTRPAVDGTALASRAAVATSEVVELDVTDAVTRNGTVSFALVSASADAVRYKSRESSTGKPQLIVTLGSPRLVLEGTWMDTYAGGALPADAILDATRATFFGSSTNSYPLNLGGGPGVWPVGGGVFGQYDRAATWDQMHTDNNAAVVFDNSELTVDGIRIDNVTDGIRPQNGGRFGIRNVRMSYVRDDCVENDHLHAGLVDDSLLDGCYSAFSARPSPTIILGGANGAANVWRIQRSLVRLQAMPGPDGGSADNLGHGGFFKWHSWDDPAQSLSPKLALHDNVFLAERVGQSGASRMGIPPGRLASCSNNVMVWLGPGDYPAPLPPCFTVTRDRGVWDAAVANWVARHPFVRP